MPLFVVALDGSKCVFRACTVALFFAIQCRPVHFVTSQFLLFAVYRANAHVLLHVLDPGVAGTS